MFWGSVYFKMLCALKLYPAAERFIESRPSLKNIRYLAEIYKKSKNTKGLMKLAGRASVLYPDNKFGATLKKSLKAKAAKKKTAVKAEIVKENNLVDILSPKTFIVIYKIARIISAEDIKSTIEYLLTSFSVTGGINIKRIGALLETSDNIALKRKVYLLLQRAYPTNHTILLRLAEILQNDCKIREAHILLSIACKYSKEYIPLKKFVFEIENNMPDEAERTFAYIMGISEGMKFKYLPMVRRVSDLFPVTIGNAMYKYEKGIARYINNVIKKQTISSDFFNTLIKLRALDLAGSVAEKQGKNAALLKRQLEQVYIRLGDLRSLLRIADGNEKMIEPAGLTSDNEVITYADAKAKQKKCIEFYIPSVFFNQSEEKPTYNTVCAFYRNIYALLHGREDAVIFPFHQFNWRESSQLLGEYGISYHTHGDEDEPKWIHIQEAVLNNCCSADTRGFAGFASIASYFDKIDDAIKDIPQEALEDNFSAMHAAYVENNVSKYNQDDSDFHCDGKYIFIPMQVRTDIVAQLTYLPCFDLLRNIVDTCPDTLKIVVKRHPFCKSFEIHQELERLAASGKIIVTNCSVHSIIKGCEAVFTANSGVGFEALMHGKPVYISGMSEYIYAASGVITSKEKLSCIWDAGFVQDRRKVLRFLYYYNKFYAIHSDDIQKIGARLDQWLDTAG